MTLDELKKTLNDEFGIKDMPDHMKGADFTLFVLAKSLWVIEHKEEAEHYRDVLFDLMVNLPNSRFYQMFGGHYQELYMRALAESSRPLTYFLRGARALAKQRAQMLTLDKYAEVLKGEVK